MDGMIKHVLLPGVDLSCKGPVQHVTTAGWDLDDLSDLQIYRDLSSVCLYSTIFVFPSCAGLCWVVAKPQFRSAWNQGAR